MAPCSTIRRWSVFVLCCILTFNAMGLTFGMGAIFTDIMDTFRVTRAVASLVQSVCLGVSFGIGLLTGHLVKWHGHGFTVITGCVLATVGYALAYLSYLAPHIGLVIFGVGVLAGIGVSFIHLSAMDVIITRDMFHGKEGMALSLYSISSAVGTAVYPLLLREMIHHYTLSGTFLIIAAVYCQMIVFGALIGCLAPQSSGESVVISEPTCPEAETTDEVVAGVARNGDDEAKLHSNPRESGDGGEDPGCSVQDCREGESESFVSRTARTADTSVDDDTLTYPDLESPEEEGIRLMSETGENISQNLLEIDSTTGDNRSRNYNAFEPIPAKSTSSSSSSKDCCGKFRKTLHHQREILCTKQFIIFAVFCPSTFLFFTQPMMFMTDMVKSNQLTVENGSFFLNIMFIGSLTGRLATWLLHKWLKSRILFVNGVSIAAGGVTCFFYSLAAEELHFVAVSLVFGISYGLMSATLLLVIREILGRDRFIVGMGTMATIACPFITLAGPYGGLIRDQTNSYEIVYYIAIGHGLVVGLVLFFTALRIPVQGGQNPAV